MNDDDLSRKCLDTAQAAKDALAWFDNPENTETIGDVRPQLAREFRRFSNNARTLADAVERPMCVGLFGASQAGKSFLAARFCQQGDKPPLIDFGAEGLRNYRNEINPAGDRESTGIVTRFSVRPYEHPEGFPVACRLLSEPDIVKILGNSYFLDSDPKLLRPMPQDVLTPLVESVRGKKSAPGAGMTVEKVWDIEEYFKKQFDHLSPMGALIDYWEDAVALAGDLDVRDRATLFSPLWGGFDRMTELYVTLVTALEKLGHPSDVFSVLEALIPRSKSIIDVQTLLGLGAEDADMLDVRTMRGAPVSLPRAVVTALTAELRLTIPEKPWDFFGNADLLDFPGARNRDPVDMGDFLRKDDALKELMVRGKVAYLFDRYVAEQELTSIFLVMKPSNQDITGLPALIADWIERTHGATSAERMGRPTLLFLVFSWFNLHLERKPGEENDGLAERFKSRLDGTMKGFLGKSHKWTSDWAGGRPFENSYWLRDPTFSGATFEAEGDIKNGGIETAVKPQEADRLERMRAEALQLEAIRQHFADPATAWDRAMALNDGGTSYLAESLAPVCTPDIKQRQIEARIDDLRAQMAAQLEKFHISDDGEKRLAERREVAFDIILSIETVADRRRLSNLIRTFQVDEGYLQDHLRRTTRRAANGPKAEPAVSAPAAPPARAGSRFGGIRAQKAAVVEEEAPRVQDKALTQAEEMISAWIAVIGQRAENERVARDLGITNDLLKEVVRELAKAARRTDLAERIAGEIRLYSFPEDRERATLRNAVIGARRISGFVSELGFAGRPASERAVTLHDDVSRVVFERPPFVSHKIALPEEPEPPAEDFLMDWGFGLKGMVDENAMSNKGQQVNWKQNAALGRIVEALGGPGGQA